MRLEVDNNYGADIDGNRGITVADIYLDDDDKDEIWANIEVEVEANGILEASYTFDFECQGYETTETVNVEDWLETDEIVSVIQKYLQGTQVTDGEVEAEFKEAFVKEERVMLRIVTEEGLEKEVLWGDWEW